VGLDFGLIEVGLDVIRDEDHDEVGGLGHVGDGSDLEAGGFGFGPAL
jgi:hypothetical protein